MSKFEIDAGPGYWVLRKGTLSLEATGVIRDRGKIRCTLSVHYGSSLIYRDNVSLTGIRSRHGVVQGVTKKVPDSGIAEDDLLALDDAIRNTPREPHPNSSGPHKNVCDTPSDVSCKVQSLAELKKLVQNWLLLEDMDALTVMLGAVVAHRIGGESPWLVLIAPPSGLKTELLRMTWRLSKMYPLSELTARTFASGLDTHGQGDPSLLARLSDEILVLKDFTSVLEMRSEERQSVLAQLREIYDGRYDKTWGTGKELHWEGRIGFLAGVTPVIDNHHNVMGLLGPRFLFYRMKSGDRKQIAEKAMSNAQKESTMRAQLADAVASFLETVGTEPPAIPPELKSRLAVIADLVTSARSPVNRDGYRREFQYAPEAESPARFARQLYALLQGVTLVLGETQASDEGLRIVTRVALDCIPVIRKRALDDLYKQGDKLVKVSAIAASVQYATNTVRFALEDLQALGLVIVQKADTNGQPDLWGLNKVGWEMMRTIHEKSEGCHTNEEEVQGEGDSTDKHRQNGHHPADEVQSPVRESDDYVTISI